MKKIFVVLLAVILAAPAFAAYYNAEQIKALQAKIAAENKPSKKANLEAELAVFSLDNPSFDTVVSTVVQIYAKYNLDEKKARGKACSIACNHLKGLAPEAYKVAAADHSGMAWRLAVVHQKMLGLSDQAVFDLLADAILSGIAKHPDGIQPIVTRLLSIAPNIDPVKAKNTLIKINRKLSPFLIKDKAKWEPIVAMVRTALETY